MSFIHSMRNADRAGFKKSGKKTLTLKWDNEYNDIYEYEFHAKGSLQDTMYII